MNNVLHPGALTANHNGRLAPQQYLTLMQYIFVSGFIFLIGAALLLGMLYNLYNAVFNHIVQNGTYIGVPIFGAFGAWLSWLGITSSRETVKDILGGKVVSIEGSASKHTERARNGKGSILYYSVGSLSFQIPAPWTWNKLPTGHARAYYTPNSKTFVNVELLSPRQ